MENLFTNFLSTVCYIKKDVHRYLLVLILYFERKEVQFIKHVRMEDTNDLRELQCVDFMLQTADIALVLILE